MICPRARGAQHPQRWERRVPQTRREGRGEIAPSPLLRPVGWLLVSVNGGLPWEAVASSLQTSLPALPPPAKCRHQLGSQASHKLPGLAQGSSGPPSEPAGRAVPKSPRSRSPNRSQPSPLGGLGSPKGPQGPHSGSQTLLGDSQNSGELVRLGALRSSRREPCTELWGPVPS